MLTRNHRSLLASQRPQWTWNEAQQGGVSTAIVNNQSSFEDELRAVVDHLLLRMKQTAVPVPSTDSSQTRPSRTAPSDSPVPSPPADAHFKNGVWHYHPHLPPLERLMLTHSPYAAGYEICSAGGCKPLAAILTGLPEFALVEVAACRQSP